MELRAWHHLLHSLNTCSANNRANCRAGACWPAQVGIGAFVLNERNEVLVVQEKSGGLRGKVRNDPSSVKHNGNETWVLQTGVFNGGKRLPWAGSKIHWHGRDSGFYHPHLEQLQHWQRALQPIEPPLPPPPPPPRGTHTHTHTSRQAEALAHICTLICKSLTCSGACANMSGVSPSNIRGNFKYRM